MALLAHELRNPLAPIRTGLELIRLARDTPASVRRVRIIMERQIGQMVRLIDDLLDVSRITFGKLVLQRTPTSLTELVQAAVDAQRAAIEKSKIELTVDMPLEACRRMRQRPSQKAMVIVAVTGWGQPQDKQRALEAGFDAHLTKPVDLEALARMPREPCKPRYLTWSNCCGLRWTTGHEAESEEAGACQRHAASRMSS